MKIALGTAQFGLNYGVANTRGQLTLDEGRKIMALARSQGIDTLDTAIAYGESELSLGSIGVDDWSIVTKLPALPDTCVDVEAWVHAQIQASLRRLGVRQLHAVLLHRPAQLFDHHGHQLFSSMQHLVEAGLTRKIGVSIYDPSELERLTGHWDFGLVQAPLNIWDRRLLESGWANRLKAQGVELHTRSAFLQGLLLMHPEKRPAWFEQWNTLWSAWTQWLLDNELTPLEACLRFAISVPEIDRVVLGVDSSAHLGEIVASAAGPLPDYETTPLPVDPILLNLAQWKLP